ncbi:MAG: helix-turn-helix transcriptional regulator [Phycisphaeraceae bacterium]|nr:helix-turn-helix transcriptional regulator [Phycisphaeraceae bacterium]
MLEHQIDILPVGSDGPWGAAQEKIYQEVQQRLTCDALAIGVLRLPKPQTEGLLCVHGWPAADVVEMLQNNFEQQALTKAAIKNGAAAATPQESPFSSAKLKNHHVVMAMAAESTAKRIWWWAIFGRKGKPFTETEIEMANLLLLRWQVHFHRADEPGVGRVLLGAGDRVQLADLDTQATLLTNHKLLDDLLQEFHPVISQRFPELPVNASRDIALNLAGQDYWVRFQRRQPVDGLGEQQWYIELRRLGEDELPVIGVLTDERIARAIAFLHENYPDSPSLTLLARQVHMSPFHFHRLFSKQAGISPKHYLQKKQLQTAKWLLRSSKEPIGAIAAHTGFASHGHFTSTFHRIIGVSPSEYRHQF